MPVCLLIFVLYCLICEVFLCPSSALYSHFLYQNVLVTSQFKRFKFQPCDAEPGDQYTSSSILCLAMCRTEELIGIPEIVLNGNFDVFVNSSHEILDMDWKYVCTK